MTGLILLSLASCQWLKKTSPNVSNDLRFTVVAMNDPVSPDQPRENDDPLLVHPSDQMIHLYAAGGETVAFQLVIPPTAVASMTLTIDPLTLLWPDVAAEKNIEKIHWRVYQLRTVSVGAGDAVFARQEPSDSPGQRSVVDPMEELGFESPGVVKLWGGGDENLLLWVEVDLPRGMTRTNLRGEIGLEGGGKKFSRPLLLHAWGFDLPDPGVNLVGLVDVPSLWTQDQMGTLRDPGRLVLPPDETRIGILADRLGDYCKLLDENGVEPWPINVYPKISGTNPERLVIEWESYQKLIQSVVTHSSRGRKYWPAPLDLSYPQTQIFGPYDSSNYRQMLSRLIREFNEKCVRTGLIGKPVAVPSWPETYESAVNDYDRAASLMKEWYRTESGMILMSPFIPTDLRPLGWPGFKPFDKVDSVAGGFCCDEKWLDPSVVDEWQKKGKQAWWRPMTSEGTLPLPQAGYPGFYSQAIAWATWKYGLSGVVLEGASHGTENTGLQAETRLIYPGRGDTGGKPMGSVRLKLLRRGLLDVAYMKALEKADQKELATFLGGHLVRYAFADAFDGSLWTLRNDGLCDNERAWMLPRLIAGFTLSRQTASAPATQRAESDQSDFLRKLYTSQFCQFTEGLSVELEGVRAKNISDPATGKDKIEWTFHVVNRNFTEDTADGEYEFVNLAPTFQVAGTNAVVTDLNWGWPFRSVMKLESPSIAIGMFGVNDQPIMFKQKDHAETVLNGRYGSLLAGRVNRLIHIDGDFEDWSENNSALAGDFKRIRARRDQ